MNTDPLFLVVDLFCGAGGTTTGFELAGGVAKVIACVNHDPEAINSHWANHPHVHHFEEDIRTLPLQRLQALVNYNRSLYPNAKVILWASLECTNFSKAKGGQPRDADSRTLAESLYMHYDPKTNKYYNGDSYIQLLQPDYVMIENVVEFMSWGPLDENGKPISRKNGQDFMRWKNEVDALGYRNEWREMNSANYGAFTSRNRLFGVFAKDGLPIVWPAATHAKNPIQDSMMGSSLKKWKAVKEVLDFSDEGKSIFEREKPLSDKTMERIYAGLIKFVAGGKDAFMLKYNSTDKTGNHYPPSIDEPAPVVTTQNRLGMVNIGFISKYYSGKPDGKNISLNGPAGTIKTIDGQALVQSQFIVQRNSGNPDNKLVDINGPCRTLTSTAGNQDVVSASFIHAYYGNGENNHGVDSAAPTLTTKDRCVLVNPAFITRDFTSGENIYSVDQPAGTLMTVPKINLVTPVPFLMHTNYNNGPTDIDSPAPVVTANRKWSYLINPSWGGNPSHTDGPCPVVVARQDKAPLYMVIGETGQVAIRKDDSDSECTIKIKEFMVLYGIIDIKMRMLKVDELLKIQGFPDGYHLTGTQADKKKFIGNSVVPQVVAAWAIAMGEKLEDFLKKVA